MPRKLHVIISGDEGRSRAVSLKVSSLRTCVVFAGILLAFLSVSAGFGIHSMIESKQLHQNLHNTKVELASVQERERLMTHEIQTLRQEKAELFRHEVAALRERSEKIEEILTQVGIEIPATAGTANSREDQRQNQGGPYYPIPMDEPEPLVDYANQMIDMANSIPLGEPASGWISSGYGTRRDPFNGRRAFHYGIDISNMIGTSIHATAAGNVVFAGRNGGYGKMVKIEHSDNYLSIYGHLRHLQVKPGDKVVRGDSIGTMGNSGRSSGSHLHYEVRHKDKPLNPYPLIYLSKK
ncbi:MAG: peptidoglycan DD-metalloendopeptidase family protein [Desulfuromonadaceae bacterium]